MKIKQKIKSNKSNVTKVKINKATNNKKLSIQKSKKYISTEDNNSTIKKIKLDSSRRHSQREFLDDPFLVDYMKILESKSYRRMAFKTQVISAPNNPHVRTRLVHTNEVISISVNIASQLGLNVSLCMAIAAGHDIGHTPYGHVGEKVISKITGKPFKHYVNSIVAAQKIERDGYGLNLTKATLEGMLYHSRGSDKIVANNRLPPEYTVVMFADKIAYTLSDLNDAVRYGYTSWEKIPKYINKTLGRNRRERIINIITALVGESRKKGMVSFSESQVFKNFDKLRDFMFREVYYKMDFDLQKTILTKIYEFFKTNDKFKGVDPALLLALLTDNEANQFGQILLQSKNPSISQIQNFGIMELLPELKRNKIDMFKADLDW